VNDANLLPDIWGGLWLVGYDRNLRQAKYNRITPAGRRIWNEDRIITPPRGYDCNYDLNFFKSDGEYLYVLLRKSGEPFEYAVALYDVLGEVVAWQTILDRSPDDVGEASDIKWNWLVASDGSVRLAYSLTNWALSAPGRDNGGQEENPVGWPWMVRYDPFTDDPTPWPDFGVQIPPAGEWPPFATDLRLIQTGDITTLVMPYYSPPLRVWGVNANGDQAWQPRLFNLDNDQGYSGDIVSYLDNVWYVAKQRAWKIFVDGAVGNGFNPLDLFQIERGRLNDICSAPLRADALNLVSIDPLRGLIGQRLESDGDLSSPLKWEVLDQSWQLSDNLNSMQIDNRLWFWQTDGFQSLKIGAVDDNNRLVVNRQIEIVAEEQYAIKKLECNGLDQFIVAMAVGEFNFEPTFRLWTFGANGQRLAQANYTAPIHPSDMKFHYWNEYGWVIVTFNQETYYLDLLDEDLYPVWPRTITVNNYVGAMYSNDDGLVLSALWTHPVSRMPHTIRMVISPNGRIAEVDTVQIFDDRLSYGPFCNAGSDGTFWYWGRSRGQGIFWIQRLDPFRGMLLGAYWVNSSTCYVIPDIECAAWIITTMGSYLTSISARHINLFVRLEDPGFVVTVFDEGPRTLADIKFDAGAERLWFLTRSYETSTGSGFETDLRAQLVGVEWNEAAEPSPLFLAPQLISLQVFPNPCNSRANIEFDLSAGALSASSNVNIGIYDPLGRLVQNLTPTGWVSAGRRAALWNADKSASGLYLVQIEIDGVIQSRRITLLK